ncbi:MAG TPA: DJ-1 family glyoxalase III [Spirochaetia bacterium]|nr:DJ-1 family glyoxalase III [Spirochaetia bacterium]
MIALLLAEGFEEVEAITPVDFLRRAGVDVRLVGIGGRLIKGAHDVAIQADMSIEDAPQDVDGVILPGGMPGAENIAGSPEALSLIRRMHRQGKLVAAICAAPAVALMKAGILEGRKVTCYPGFESRLAGCEFVEDRVVIDGNIVTSRGPGTAAEFALALIEILTDRETSRDIHGKTLQR